MSLKKIKYTQAQLFLLVMAIVFFSYYVTLKDMFAVWWEDSSAYSHGLLLVPIGLYIFFERWKKQAPDIELKLNAGYLVLLLLAGGGWMASHLVFVQAAEHFFFLGVLFFSILTLLGTKKSIPFMFPLILVLMTIPVWGSIISNLRLATTIVSAYMLDITGITSVREGYLILIPAGTFEVADSCSGLRYQLAGASISLLYIYMAKMRFLMAALYLVIEVIVVFFANVIRIYVVVFMGDKTNMQSSLVEDHLWLGWIIFAIFISVFIWLSNKIVPLQPAESQSEESWKRGLPVSGNVKIKAALTLMAGILPPVAINMYSLDAYRNKAIILQGYEKIAGWQQVNNRVNDSWKIDFQKSNGLLNTVYKNQNKVISLKVRYYLFQQQGQEAVYLLNRVYDKKTWWKESSETRHLKAEDLPNFSVKETIIRSRAGKKKLVWLWYYTNYKNIVSDKQAKLENLKAILKRKPAITVYILGTDINSNLQNARTDLASFLKNGLKDLLRIIPEDD